MACTFNRLARHSSKPCPAAGSAMTESTTTRPARSHGHEGVLSTAAGSHGGDGGDDLISLLPDCILGEIVTRLPTVDAVRAQLLSSRWRHVWSSSPLNLDLQGYEGYNGSRYYYAIVSAHPGPARRVKIVHISDNDDNRWLRDPALSGLQATTTLSFPHLEQIAFWSVDISEDTLHGVLASSPALNALLLDGCTGFTNVRINSSSIKTFAVAFPCALFSEKQVTIQQVVIEDAPLLEKLIPFCGWSGGGSFELRVVSAPKLRVLGSLSMMISKLELGSTVFKLTHRRVNLVTRDEVSREERLVIEAVRLSTKLPTVKILALEDVDRIDVLTNYLMCFPCLQKLYISASQGFRSAGHYDKLTSIECLELHIKKIVLKGYEGKRSDVRFAKFFLANAQALELFSIRFRNTSSYTMSNEDWIAEQRRHLQLRNRASQHVKFHFEYDNCYRHIYFSHDTYDISEQINDSARNDPFDGLNRMRNPWHVE
ncbi:hypothetical protein EJB05_13085, partial [Eragrostis curvula]